MKWPFAVILSGPPAAGKNTVARKLCSAHPSTMAEIDLDRIKFCVEGAPSTDFFLDLASAIGQSMMRLYLNAQLSVVVHKAFCSYQFVKPFIEIANELGVSYAYFKLEAPLEELLKRNRARGYQSSEEDLKRIYQFSKSSVHPEGIVIDTLTNGLNGTYNQIIETIQTTP